MKRERKLGAAILTVALLSGAAGLAGSHLVRSPAQVAADAAPPPPSRLTAAVTAGAVDDTVAFRGKVSLGSSRSVTPATAGYVTSVDVRRGETLHAGQLLMTVNDRPVLLLRGRIPLYRDLTPGSRGPDVRRFQEALTDAGFPVRDAAGFFGSSTLGALTRLYRSHGFLPPTTEVPTVPATTSTGVVLPGPVPTPVSTATKAELVMVPRLPSRVSAIAARTGSSNLEKAVTLTASEPVVTGQINPADAAHLHRGQQVQVASDTAGLAFRGTVAKVGAPADTGSDGFVARVTVRPTEPLPLRAAGTEVRVTAVTAVTDEGLIVPTAAVHTDSGGATYVEVVRDGVPTRVAVTVTGEADGRTSIRAPGNQVRIGERVVLGVL